MEGCKCEGRINNWEAEEWRSIGSYKMVREKKKNDLMISTVKKHGFSIQRYRKTCTRQSSEMKSQCVSTTKQRCVLWLPIVYSTLLYFNTFFFNF